MKEMSTTRIEVENHMFRQLYREEGMHSLVALVFEDLPWLRHPWKQMKTLTRIGTTVCSE